MSKGNNILIVSLRSIISWIIISIILCVLLSSCSEEEKQAPKELPQSTIIMNQLENLYDYDAIIEEYNQTGAFSELCKKIGIEYTKIIDGFQYTVINSTHGYLLIISDINNQALIRTIEFSPLSNLKPTSQLQIGMTLKDVQNADPSGAYDFLYAGSSDFPKYSLHFLRRVNVIVYNTVNPVMAA